MTRERYDDEDDDRPRPRLQRDDDDFDRRPPKKSGGTLKVVLIVLGVVGVVVVVGCGGMFFAVNKVRDAAARQIAINNMKQFTLAVESYQDAYDKIPSPFLTNNSNGLPTVENAADRLSWRVDLLPYIEQENLFREIQRNEAWNSSTNQPYTTRVVKTFIDPLDPADANTRVRCFYDNGALFSTNPQERISLGGVTDGTSNTIMFAESAERVPWAQFNEWAYEPSAAPPALGHPTRNVFLVGMADGSVRTVTKSVDPASLKAAITRAGNDAPGPDFK